MSFHWFKWRGIKIDRWFLSLFEHPLIQLFFKRKCYKESQYISQIKAERSGWVNGFDPEAVLSFWFSIVFLPICTMFKRFAFMPLPPFPPHLLHNLLHWPALEVPITLLGHKRPKKTTPLFSQASLLPIFLCHKEFPIGGCWTKTFLITKTVLIQGPLDICSNYQASFQKGMWKNKFISKAWRSRGAKPLLLVLLSFILPACRVLI